MPPLFFHYHAKTINAERVGRRVVRVECAQCGCEYFYHFARIGFGSSQAPYGLGVGRATRSANQKAQKDLDRRMATEADLVPCPKCNWVNDELVTGFRRANYRKLGEAARLVAAAGVIIGFIVGLAVGISAPGELPYVLILPAGCLLFAWGLLVLRKWLRSRIRPNENHPFPPTLPPGSPRALLRDPESGVLMPAAGSRLSLEPGQDWCDFPIGRRLPGLCCGCLQPTRSDIGDRLRVTATIWLTVPRCSDCEKSAKQRTRKQWWNGCMASVAATGLIVIPVNLDWAEFAVASAGLLAVFLLVTALVVRRLTAPARVAGGDRSRGVARLRFRNPDYARAVAECLEG